MATPIQQVKRASVVEMPSNEGNVKVDWVIEVLEEDAELWHKGKASQVNEASNMIFIEGFSMGLEGEVEIDWDFIRLIECKDTESTELFEKLAIQQKEHIANLAEPHIANFITGVEKVKNMKRSSVIGVGLTGFVKIVQRCSDKKVLALKCLSKHKVTSLRQQKNVMAEKRVLSESNHPFIMKLVKTQQDKDALYMVMELVRGGELFHLLHGSGTLDNKLSVNHARFYVGCVVSVFEYLHKPRENGMHWLYRDLKPENLLIDTEGYIKVVDFGFAKKVNTKTFTFLGTPEYIAPELVKRKGYGKGVDYWALGCLIFEMLTGGSPFAPPDSNIYKRICDKEPPMGYLHVDDTTKKFVSQLLEKRDDNRLGSDPRGIEGLKSHEFFKGFDFVALENRALKAPWIPKLNDELDFHLFDEYSRDEENIVSYHGDSSWSQGF